MRFRVSIVSLAILAGCATPPDRIKPVDLPETAYMDRNCAALRAERSAIATRLDASSGRQKSAANADAMGVFLVGLPVSSMTAGDRGSAVAVYKGQMLAVDRALARKSC